MILSRSTRRRPTWSLGDILPASDTAWRGVALICLSLSTIGAVFVGVFGYFIGRWNYLEYRDGNLPLWSVVAFAAVYGSFVIGPVAGWFFAARSRFRSAILAASFPIVLYGGLFLVAQSSR